MKVIRQLGGFNPQEVGVKKKWTKEQREQLKLFWDSQEETTNRYRQNISVIESVMESALGIEGLEFFRGMDGEICGIGNRYAPEDKRYETLHIWRDGELKTEEEIDESTD